MTKLYSNALNGGCLSKQENEYHIRCALIKKKRTKNETGAVEPSGRCESKLSG